MLKDFNEVKIKRLEIARCEEHVGRLRSSMEGLETRYKNSPGKKDFRADRISAVMAELDTWEYKYAESLSEYEAYAEKVKKIIGKLPAKQRLIMELRYVEGKSWKEVAAAVHYSEDSCIRIRREAIKKLSDNVG